MPIKIDDRLPARESLEQENIFVMTESRAKSQDIRALKIIILNLMPTKITTETQLLRLLSNSPLQVDIEFLQTATHKAKNTSESHMSNFYHTFDEIKDKKYDGMIITGAPVELMEFEEVDYWDELCQIFEWTKPMSIPPSISAGAHRQAITIITAYLSTLCRKRCSVYFLISLWIFIIRFCEALTMCIMSLSQDILKSAFRILPCARIYR